jgi:hypothetical protein
MKMTVLHAFLTIKDKEFRKMVFENLDERYINHEVHTLSYALTFGVLTDKERWADIVKYSATNLRETGNEIPLHKHDCNNCVFLGSFDGEDLYYHPGQMVSLIARWGKGGEYNSGLIFGEMDEEDPNSPLGEAYRRACKLGLNLPKQL